MMDDYVKLVDVLNSALEPYLTDDKEPVNKDEIIRVVNETLKKYFNIVEIS